MANLSIETWVLIGVALTFAFYNGLHVSGNIVATIIATRAMPPRLALWMAALGIGVGSLIFGVAVATTIGRDIVDQQTVTVPGVYAALAAAIGWNMLTLLLGIPSSSSHALFGGLIGAVWAGYGLGAVLWSGMWKVLLSLFLSPILGMLAGYYSVRSVYWLAQEASPQINAWLRRGQILSGALLALANGTNDAQKTMGIITLGLVADQQISSFAVPRWVVVISAVAMALGTFLGGWNLIKTLGHKFYRLRPVHGFSAQTASSVVILAAGLLGGPVSTTHVVSSAIVGAGSATRVQMVRWSVIDNMLLSWVVTLPVTALLGALSFVVIDVLAG